MKLLVKTKNAFVLFTQRLKLAIMFAIFTLAFGFQVSAFESFEAGSFREVLPKIVEKSELYGSDKVLVVLDLDNTLLAMSQDLGSDQWFDWQNSLLGTGSTSAVANDFAGLLEAQLKLFFLGRMQRTDSFENEFLEMLGARQIDRFVLTSRGPETRDVTLRELAANSLFFYDSKNYSTKTYLPYDLAAPEKSCISKIEASDWKLNKARPVTLVGGTVMLSSGLHKGAMLRSVLCGQNKNYKAIVFVDDKLKNVLAVQQAYSDDAIDLVTFRFTAEDDRVTRFHSGSKTEVDEQWQHLKSILGH